MDQTVLERGVWVFLLDTTGTDDHGNEGINCTDDFSHAGYDVKREE